MTTTSVSICNAALLMVGADDINSFSDSTTEAKLCNALYEDTRNTVLQYHPWVFSLKQIDLGGATTTAPLFDYKYSYQIPSDALRIVAAEDSTEYAIYGDKIHSNTSPKQIIYQALVAEDDMPSYFVRTLQLYLARYFCISLQEDVNKSSMFMQAADKELIRARNIDSQQQTPLNIPDKNYTFINVRG